MTVETSLAMPARFARIVAPDYEYQLTRDDLLWLGRAMQGEGGNHAATAWTYVQRLAGRRLSSLRALVLAHSQVVNPIWRRDGSRCAPGGRYYGTNYCSPRSLDARDRAASLTWEQIPSRVRSVLVQLAAGTLANPAPRATDFANDVVSQGFLRRHPDARVVLREGNWYLAEGPSSSPRPSVSWPNNYVRLAPPDGSSPVVEPPTYSKPTANVAGTLALAAGVGAAAWLGARWLRSRG
jgi:hypothetical protein